MTQDNYSVDVSIAAHYAPARIPFLVRSLEAINQWPHRHVHIAIATNDLALSQSGELREILHELEAKGRAVAFEHAYPLDHPWHLTWWHKQHLRDWCERAGPDDLFVYVEDDIAIPAAAIAYFHEALNAAKRQGLIPGFLRYENGRNGQQISVDFRSHQCVGDGELILLDGQPYVAPEYPYWAGFVLDRDLCAEYLASPWSQIESADSQPQSAGHSCRVQSAWALTYENVPQGLASRMIIPVDEQLRPHPDCMVWHAANNYTESKTHGFGTIAVDAIFVRPGLGATLANLNRRLSGIGRRIIAKAKSMMGGAR